jgi:hypothetical protein
MRTPEPAAADGAAFEKAVLDELVYEKLRGSLDLCAVVGFQVELSASVERVLQSRRDGPRKGTEVDVEDRSDIVMECFHRAWQRLSEEVLSELSAHELMNEAPERTACGMPPSRACVTS